MAAPTMKTVASDVPPTGTFSIGTGNASTKVAAARSATRPASWAGEGSKAAKAEVPRTSTTVAKKSTGAMTGRSRRVSRERRSGERGSSGRLSPLVTSVAVDPTCGPFQPSWPPVRTSGSPYSPQLPFPRLKQGTRLLLPAAEERRPLAAEELDRRAREREQHEHEEYEREQRRSPHTHKTDEAAPVFPRPGKRAASDQAGGSPHSDSTRRRAREPHPKRGSGSSRLGRERDPAPLQRPACGRAGRCTASLADEKCRECREIRTQGVRRATHPAIRPPRS